MENILGIEKPSKLLREKFCDSQHHFNAGKLII